MKPSKWTGYKSQTENFICANIHANKIWLAISCCDILLYQQYTNNLQPDTCALPHARYHIHARKRRRSQFPGDGNVSCQCVSDVWQTSVQVDDAWRGGETTTLQGCVAVEVVVWLIVGKPFIFMFLY